MKMHGDAGWETFPSYLDTVVPRVLDVLRDLDLTITFFIVGQDAVLERNHATLRSIAAAGHEIGNHSFHHESWLQLYSEEKLTEELLLAEDAIRLATGVRPIGFRGPGYSLSPATLRVLARRGYLYDASTFPTYLGPLARAYYFMTSRLNVEQKREREMLFGRFVNGFYPLRPYRWQMAADGLGNDLIEIPVTTLPALKVPFHMSYILFIATYSSALALAYFGTALALCRIAGVQPSLLLHPLDFISSDDTEDLSFFPAMKMPSKSKLSIVGQALRLYAENFEILSMQQHAQEVIRSSDQRLIAPASILMAVPEEPRRNCHDVVLGVGVAPRSASGCWFRCLLRESNF